MSPHPGGRGSTRFEGTESSCSGGSLKGFKGCGRGSTRFEGTESWPQCDVQQQHRKVAEVRPALRVLKDETEIVEHSALEGGRGSSRFEGSESVVLCLDTVGATGLWQRFDPL